MVHLKLKLWQVAILDVLSLLAISWLWSQAGTLISAPSSFGVLAGVLILGASVVWIGIMLWRWIQYLDARRETK